MSLHTRGARRQSPGPQQRLVAADVIGDCGELEPWKPKP